MSYRSSHLAQCSALLTLLICAPGLSSSQTTGTFEEPRTTDSPDAAKSAEVPLSFGAAPGDLYASSEPQAPIVTAPGQVDSEKSTDPDALKRQKAREQIRRQEHQRVLGIVPEFNTTSIPDAVPLTAKQKFSLAFRTAVDPVTFLIAALDAGYGQLTDNYHDYGQGVEGFSKYWGASYADSFDGTMLGNALFPALFHEDPRYFRKGTGSFGSRLGYALMSTVRAKTDHGNWGPNFGNVLGNIAAGGIANVYYPASDRGVGLTFERAFTVTGEGAFGAIFNEFWPDIVHHYTKKRHQNDLTPAQP